MKKYFVLGTYLLFMSMAFSQPDNLQLCQQLMEKFAQKEGKQYAKIKGNLPKKNPFQTDDCAAYMLEVFSPEIDYQRINKNIFVRKVEIRFIKSFKDSLISKTEMISDSLSAKQIRNIRAKSPNPYKGENPLILARYVMPSVGILGSAALIVALFYLRSN